MGRRLSNRPGGIQSGQSSSSNAQQSTRATFPIVPLFWWNNRANGRERTYTKVDSVRQTSTKGNEMHIQDASIGNKAIVRSAEKCDVLSCNNRAIIKIAPRYYTGGHHFWQYCALHQDIADNHKIFPTANWKKEMIIYVDDISKG